MCPPSHNSWVASLGRALGLDILRCIFSLYVNISEIGMYLYSMVYHSWKVNIFSFLVGYKITIHLKIDDILLGIDEIWDMIASRLAPLHFPSSISRFNNDFSFWMEGKWDIDPIIIPPPSSPLPLQPSGWTCRWCWQNAASWSTRQQTWLCKMGCLGENGAVPACISWGQSHSQRSRRMEPIFVPQCWAQTHSLMCRDEARKHE